jgi:hypothetical protein
MRSRCTQISFRPPSSLRFTRLPFQDDGQREKIETSDNSPLRMRMKEMVHEQLVAKGSSKSAWKTVPTCWYICYSV